MLLESPLCRRLGMHCSIATCQVSENRTLVPTCCCFYSLFFL
jgi:hypothetical protein